MFRFFLNSQTTGYLRNLETEFGESTNSIRVELNKLEKAGLLKSVAAGNKKLFYANTSHPLFNDINSIVKKVVGIDTIIEHIATKVRNLQAVYLAGRLAEGKDSKTIDLILIGEEINREYIDLLILKSKELISRDVKYHILAQEEMKKNFLEQPVLLIWSSETFNH